MPDRNSTAHTADTTETGIPIHTTDYRRNLSSVRQLYAIIDSVTDTLIGGIQVHLNDQSAIRTLYDIAMGDTMVNKHPLDFDLWRLGALGQDHRINANLVRITTGAQIETMIKAIKASGER